MVNKILEIARGELGYKEGANNNTKYGADYGLNYNPWCQMFIWWIAQKSGIGEDIIPKTASCPTTYRWFRDRGQVISANQAKAGDIVFFQWNGSRNADHVGIIENVQNGIITTIEGNKNDAVERRQVNVNNSCIFAVCRPNYIEKTQTEIRKSNEEIRDEVIDGKWDRGETRKDLLNNAGYDYNVIQDLVNEKLLGKKINNSQTVQTVYYKVTANSGLWLLDANGKKIKAYIKGTEVEYISEGYTKYGYNYVKVKVLNDDRTGYMARKYLA